MPGKVAIFPSADYCSFHYFRAFKPNNPIVKTTSDASFIQCQDRVPQPKLLRTAIPDGKISPYVDMTQAVTYLHFRDGKRLITPSPQEPL